MIQLPSIKLVLGVVALFLLPSIVASGQLWAGPVDQQRISAAIVAILQEDLQMSEAITLIQKSPDPRSSRQYLQSQGRLTFLATKRQDPMVLDGYSVSDPESSIVGYSLFYYGSEGPLLMLDASVNPSNVAAKQRAGDLVRRSLDSVSNPDGSTLHFVGVYDLDSQRVLKIIVRKAGTVGEPDYAIRYVVSQR